MYEDELAFASGLADRAAEIGLSVFRGDVHVTIKADLTPVTQADTAIETMVRGQIAQSFPDDRVLGEEEGGDADGPGRVWIVDPIDATANFARGIPIWATLIALQVDGALVLGVASAPALGERYEAARGAGARCNGSPIDVSAEASVDQAQILFAELSDWLLPTHDERMLEILVEAKRTRAFGDFWGHVLVARGAAEAMIEPELALWDYAALSVIVEEAGGRVSALDGGQLRHGGSVLSSNGAIHDELVRRLSRA
ncbi:MAG: histidinol-phosphatase [Actinomycetota bacterium]|nr:histidinol-phosphatase [Actinomycetota bacterium]